MANGNGHDQNDDDDNRIDWSQDENVHNDNDDSNDIDVIEFPRIEKQIRRSLRRFGNIFPKLNWSSCEDAHWIQACGSKCSSLTDIFLLLKSSDKIVHDLIDPYVLIVN